MMLRIKNWKKYQHYKGRRPPWIKLHVSLLNSPEWVRASDSTKLSMVCCMLVASMNDGCVRYDAKWIKHVCHIDWRVNFKPLIACGFLEEVLASASSVQANAPKWTSRPRVQSQKERKKEGNGHSREEGEASGHPRKKTPPRHGAFTKDRSRVWFNHGTPEWAAYADDYREHHNGVDPPVQWDGAGSWFNWSGESILEQERQGS